MASAGDDWKSVIGVWILIILAVIVVVGLLVGTCLFFVGRASGQPPRAGIDESNRPGIEESEEVPTATIKRSPRCVYTDFKQVNGCVRSAAQP